MTPQRFWGVKKVCQATLLSLARYNGWVYASVMALLTRIVRHLLDMDATEAAMQEYFDRLDSYTNED